MLTAIFFILTGDNIILTGETGQPSHGFDFNQFAVAIHFVFDFQWNNWNFHSQVGGPALSEGDFDYAFFEIAANITYTFYFVA